MEEQKKELQPHQQRVVDERTDLNDKITKIHAFFKNEVFNGLPQEDQDLLNEQSQIMMNYSDILLKRINRF